MVIERYSNTLVLEFSKQSEFLPDSKFEFLTNKIDDALEKGCCLFLHLSGKINLGLFNHLHQSNLIECLLKT